jgi:hypothetical protein
LVNLTWFLTISLISFFFWKITDPWFFFVDQKENPVCLNLSSV